MKENYDVQEETEKESKISYEEFMLGKGGKILNSIAEDHQIPADDVLNQLCEQAIRVEGIGLRAVYDTLRDRLWIGSEINGCLTTEDAKLLDDIRTKLIQAASEMQTRVVKDKEYQQRG